MNINFNSGKSYTPKPEAENNEDNYEVEEITPNQNNKLNEDAKKKLYKILFIIAGAFIIIILLILIASLFTKKSYTYADIEKIMKNAAIEYFNEHKNYLPKSNGDTVEVNVTNLIVEEKMKDLSEYTKSNIACKGYVEVEKRDSSYIYSPFLNCGDNYETIELYKKLTKEKNLVTEGYGLYNLNSEYTYKGEKVKNYLQLNNNLWRIVKVNSDNSILLVSNESLNGSLQWDNRYNTQKGYNIGINNYPTSRIKEALDEVYKGIYKNNEKLLSAEDKEKIKPFTQCISKRDKLDQTKDNSTECIEKYENQKLGLLTVSDYLNASVDKNCNNTISAECQNYNYLQEEKDYWLATTNSQNTYEVYIVLADGGIELRYATSSAYIKPTITLKSNVLYESGNGTKSNPYKIK